MSPCNRFEQEGLLILQAGGQLDEHFSTCQACIEARQKYESLEKLILSADSASAPTAGWQDRVLESVKKPPQDRMGFWPTSLVAGFAAIMFTGVLVNQYANKTKPQNELEIILASSGTSYRGASAKIGDTMQVKAHHDKSEFLQIRVYRDDRLFDVCGVQTPCQLTGNIATRNTTLSALGEYQTMLVRTDKEIKFTANRLDQDVLLAGDNAVWFKVSPSITVR